MDTATLVQHDPAAVASVNILEALTKGYQGNLAVRLWNGEVWRFNSEPAAFTVDLKHPGAVRAMFSPFDRVGLGEAYIFDDFDIEGDIFAFTQWLRHIIKLAECRSLWAKLRLLRALWRLPNQKNPRDISKAGKPSAGDHSKPKDREAISYSYDFPPDFYSLFLDKHRQYSCGYFASPEDSLDSAQVRKLDYICKKLRLKAGERFLDVGCGWGGLVIHAARRYGVHATGVTLSREQAESAERAVNEAGLRTHVRIVLADYRDFQAAGEYDKAASIGMAEHIGVRNLPVYFKKVYDCLRPGGAYLHHSITLRPNTPYPRWTAFARKYVFPNGELQTILRVQESAALAGFEIRDVENLREHYVLTLENWVRNLEAHRGAVLKIVGEVTYRIFRIYMSGATLGFKYGTYGLHQVLVSKTADGSAQMPLTRTEWYT
jgi:cyclopropane-fatty-acyl-phospholipid synthase